MINNNFILGHFLAQQEKKRLEDQGATLPNNFNLKYGLLFGSYSNNSLLPSIVLQQEVGKQQPEIPIKARREIDRTRNLGLQALEAVAVFIPANNKQDALDALPPGWANYFDSDFKLKTGGTQSQASNTNVSQASTNNSQRAQIAANLQTVKGIDSALANALITLQIHTIEQLATQDAKQLKAKLKSDFNLDVTDIYKIITRADAGLKAMQKA